ncbi:MAG: GreA/GreB family elongation factor [Patescibacteria group bacterium]
MQLPTRKKERERLQSEDIDVYVTQEKLERMKHDLEKLETKERGEAAAEVIRTGEMGDFSENAGYQWAKSNLRRINSRILTLADKINRAIIIDEKHSDGVIRIGSTVTIQTNNNEYTYQILGSQETNPSRGKISHNSPLGQALLGHRQHEQISLSRDGTMVTYTIVNVS